MSDKKTAEPGKENASILQEEQEKASLVQTLRSIEQENKILIGKSKTSDPQLVEKAKKDSAELKNRLQTLQTEVNSIWQSRKKPSDTKSLEEKLSVLKKIVISYCIDKKLDESLWKKIESL